MKRKIRSELYSAFVKILAVLYLGFICQSERAALMAEDGMSASELAAELAKLPLPDAKLNNGRAISGFNDNLINLVIPELRDYVRDGQFSGAAFASLPLALDTGLTCCFNASEPLEILEDGLLSVTPQKVQNLFFDNNDLSQSNTAKIGYSALWNAQALMLKNNFVSSNVRLRYIRNNSVFREISGDYSQIYPRQFNADDKTGQIFRELFQVTAPSIVNNFAWLRFRFYDQAEDVIFMHSPVTHKVRELTGSNSSDALLSSSVALDDFFVWTQKINTVEVLSYSEDTYLMPIVMATTGAGSPALKEDQCLELTNPELAGPDQSSWSYQVRKFPGTASWLLNDAVYVPAKLLRLFLETKDPYSLYGRQILYIDQTTGLPIYKIVFDNAGQLWKIIIGHFAFATKQQKNFNFYPYAQVIIDLKSSQTALLEYLTFKVCGQVSAAKELEKFAPQKLVK